MSFEQITGEVAFHGEGPVWHESWGGLRWVDMLAGSLLTMSADGQISHLEVGSRIAAFVRPRRGGGYVVGIERGLALADSAFAVPTALPPMWDDPTIRMNECGVDLQGRLYAGSLSYEGTPVGGTLYRMSADDGVVVIFPQVTISNGLDFSPDGRLAYYNDTLTHATDVLDVTEDGQLVNRRIFHDAGDGLPDGLTVDSAGNVWCAINQHGLVRLYSPSAEILGEWAFPCQGVTAVALGGADGKDVFITTSKELADQPGSGAIWHMRAEIPGQPTREVAL